MKFYYDGRRWSWLHMVFFSLFCFFFFFCFSIFVAVKAGVCFHLSAFGRIKFSFQSIFHQLYARARIYNVVVRFFFSCWFIFIRQKSMFQLQLAKWLYTTSKCMVDDPQHYGFLANIGWLAFPSLMWPLLHVCDPLSWSLQKQCTVFFSLTFKNSIE